MRWTDEDYRAAHRCRNPTSFSTGGHRCSMNSLSPLRSLRAPRHGPYLSALSLNTSLRSASSTTLFKVLCRRSELIAPSCQVLRSVAQSPRTPTPFLPTIEFAWARVRRNHGRPRPNGFTGRARRSLPLFTSRRERASGKALTSLGNNCAGLRLCRGWAGLPVA